MQLIAQEAKARARLGESDLQPLLDSGREILDRLPYPGRPDNHFEVDPAKWEYYAMDVHRLAGNDQLARQYATAVIQDNLASQASTAPASRPSLVMVAGELSSELTTRYPNEPLTHHFTEAAPTL
ncbi:hypothetical protein [Kribbella sp. NPDC006257]|uniref:hypothetical protein n=1 Tax=Kribbella sp. NPDC006257 TaxID=3156738 RepID=UPI0033B33C2F